MKENKKRILFTLMITPLVLAGACLGQKAYDHYTHQIRISFSPFIKIQSDIKSINLNMSLKESDTSVDHLAQLDKKIENTIQFSTKKYYLKPKRVTSYKKAPSYKKKRASSRVHSKYEINDKALVLSEKVSYVSPFKVEANNWEAYFNKSKVSQKLARLNNPIFARTVSKDLSDPHEDVLSLRQPGTQKDAVKNFVNDEPASIEDLLAQAVEARKQALSKKNKPKKNTREIEQSDEMVFIDYSDEKKETAYEGVNINFKKESVAVTSRDDSMVSSNVNSAYKRLLAKNSVKSHDNSEEILEKLLASNNGKAGNLNDPSKSEKLTSQNPFSNNPLIAAKQSLLKENKEIKNFNLTLKIIDSLINKGEGEDHHGFDFIPSYDKGLILSDEGDGEIILSEDLNAEKSILRGTIIKRNKIRTKVDLTLEKGNHEIYVPLLDQEYMIRLLDELQLDAIGGFLLSDLSEDVEDAQIDSYYERKIYLNENLKVVEKNKDYRFILFLGVEPGNTLLQYLTFNNEIAEKVIHIVEDELYFDFVQIKEAQEQRLEFLEKKTLARKLGELDIDAGDMRIFNTDIKANKAGLNLYTVKRPITTSSFRNYVELGHLKESIFIGYSDTHKIEVPSSDYIEYILSSLELESLEQRCLLQINISSNKVLEGFTIDGDTARGPMVFDRFFLDKEGEVNTEDPLAASKIYLLGEGQGIFNMMLKYSDGSIDYTQSFCSKDTFLVEQL